MALSPMTEQAFGTVPEALMVLESVAAKPLSGRTAIMPKLAVIAVNRRRFMGIPGARKAMRCMPWSRHQRKLVLQDIGSTGHVARPRPNGGESARAKVFSVSTNTEFWATAASPANHHISLGSQQPQLWPRLWPAAKRLDQAPARITD